MNYSEYKEVLTNYIRSSLIFFVKKFDIFVLVFLVFRFCRMGMGSVRVGEVEKGIVRNEFVRIFLLEIDDVRLGD